MKNLLKEFLDAGNFITVNKTLIKKLGLLESVLIGYLINQYNYFDNKNMLNKNDEFFCKNEDIMEYTGLSEYHLKTTKQVLIDYGIIKITKRDLPAKNYYKINYEKIEKVFKNTKQEKSQTSSSKVPTSDLEDSTSPDINKHKLDLPTIDKQNTLSKDKVEDFVPKSKRLLKLNPIDFPYIEIINKTMGFLDGRVPPGYSGSIFSKHKLPTKENLTTTKTILNLVKNMKAIESGDLAKYKLVNGFAKAAKYLDGKDRTNVLQLLKQSLIHFLTFFEPENFPANKDTLPHTLNDFIYNPRAESSWFLKCLEEVSNPLKATAAKKVEESVNSVFLNSYIDFFEEVNPMILETKRSEIVDNIRTLHNWWKFWADQFGQDIIYIGDQFFKVNSESAFTDYHIDFLRKTFPDIQPGHILLSGTAFKMFLQYCNENDIDFKDTGLCWHRVEARKKEKANEPRKRAWEEIRREIRGIQENEDPNFNPSAEEMEEMLNKRLSLCG